MGKASIKTDLVGIDSLIRKWGQTHKFAIADKPTVIHRKRQDKPADFVKIMGKGAFYVAEWRCCDKDGCSEVSLNLKPRLYLNAILHLLLFSALFYTVFVMEGIVQKYTNTKLLQCLIGAILTILLIWWKDSRLSFKLARLENSFWNLAKENYDTLQLTRADGSVYSRKSRLTAELLLTGTLVCIGIIFLGGLGAILACLLCLPFLVMIAAETLRSSNPQWNWHFWIISNMARWTFLMLAILGIATILSSLEIIQNLETYDGKSNNSSLRQTIKQGTFRAVYPATAEFLEEDVNLRLNRMADRDISGLKDKTPQERSRWRRIFFYLYGLAFFLIAAITVFIFVALPLRGIFKSRKIWCDEVGKSEGLQGPTVPYLPRAWKRPVPRMLRFLIFFHYIFGGLINLAAAIFCLDGLSYLFIGRTLLIERSANLWSWIFATSQIVMGSWWGQVAGAALVLAINIPILLVLMTYARRWLRNVFLTIHISLGRLNGTEIFGEKYSLMDKYLTDVCLKFHIKRPVLFLTKDSNALVRLHWLSLTGRPVIEITSGTFDLLSQEELKAVIAHELGHVRQGLWKIRILKYLSSAALFPNHYLTLCLNWSQKEIHADQFALELTDDQQSLKNALVKMSTAQISYLNGSNQQKTSFSRNWLVSKISTKWHSIMISARFFWGDNLFGYAHPYLSERLEMLNAYTPKKKVG